MGAFGGIMAGVGHITVFGLADYGRSFKQTSTPLDKLLTDSIRVCNQYLAGLSAFISSLTYYRMGRLVMPLGLCLAGGGILGAYLIPVLTAGKINLSSHIGYFGIVVCPVAFVLLYEPTPKGQASKKAAKAGAKAFEAYLVFMPVKDRIPYFRRIKALLNASSLNARKLSRFGDLLSPAGAGKPAGDEGGQASPPA